MYIILICIVIVLIIAYIFNFLYKKTNAYYNCNIMNWDFKNKRIEKVVVLGSTYARFAFESSKILRLDISNLTMKSQSLYNDLKNFRRIKRKIKKNSYVFISVAPCTLLYEGNRSLIKFKTPGNPTATFKQKIDYIFPLWRVKRVFSLFNDEARYYDVYDSKSLVNEENAVVAEMNQLVCLWKTMFGLEGLKDVRLSKRNKRCIKKNINILEKLICECLEYKCIPVLITTPFSNRLNCHFSDEFVNAVLETPIADLKRKYPQVKYLNYRTNDFFQEDVGLYMDGGFLLNRRGSQLYLKEIFEKDMCYIK